MIKKPHELTSHPFLKCLVYGQPGIGKSTFALSAPNPVLLDFDNGVHRVRYEHQTDTLQVNNWSEVQEVLNNNSLSPYKTIVIDTAGKMLDYMTEYLIKGNPKLGKSNGALSLQGYGERKGEFLNFLKKISIMGKHLIFVAHEKEEKDGDTTVKRPEVGGSSGTDLFKELDFIGYMEANGKKRTISFTPTDKYYAKNSCNLVDVMELVDVSEGNQNNFFTENILKVYETNLQDRKDKVEEYNTLMEVIEAKVEAIKDAKTANEVMAWGKSFEGFLADSKIQLRHKLSQKAKSLELIFDTEKVQYKNKAKEPTNKEKETAYAAV